MTKLSVFINGIAALLNANGNNITEVAGAAADIAKFGARGITVRPDAGGVPVGYDDTARLRGVTGAEINIAGIPTDQFIRMARTIRPDRVILLPEATDIAGAGRGWDTKHNLGYLSEICEIFNADGIPASILTDPDTEMVRYASETGCKFIELCTEAYAEGFSTNREQAVEPYYFAAEEAARCGIGANAWCGLNLRNIGYFSEAIPQTDTITAGDTIICDALYLGLENAVNGYLEALRKE